MPKYTFKSHFATEFEHINAKINQPTVLYLHGFCSDCWGRKPETVKAFCLEHGLGFFRFEYAGHGADKENFENADFDTWKSQALEIIDEIIKGDIICVGSSLGGWLSLLMAAERPERVVGVLGLAAAPNFIIKFEAYATEEQKKQLTETGKMYFGNEKFMYTITKRFIDTAKANCFDEDMPWQIACPVHLLQGMNDAFVKWTRAFEIAQKVISDKVEVKLIKNADHRLNDDAAATETRNSLAVLANIVNI